jgi:cell division septal protein FtsQ
VRLPTLPVVRPSRRVATAAAGVALTPLAAFGAYTAMERTSAFSVQHVEISGAPGSLEQTVRRTALAEVDGRSLLAVSASELEHALQALPHVQQASVDRAFPSTLKISIVPERPAAVAVSGRDWAVVAEDGRVLDTTDRKHAPKLPHVVAPGRLPPPGARLVSTKALDGLTVVVALPDNFGGRVVSVRTDDRGALVARLQMGVDIRLGPADDAATKLQVASLVLSRYPKAARAALRYVDVSAPEHPVVCPKDGDPSTVTASDGSTTDGSTSDTGTPPSTSPPGGMGCVVPATPDGTATTTETTTTSTTP